MQKFGLDSLLDRASFGVEWEIMEEQATALGRSGRQLQAAIDRYHATPNPSDEQTHAIANAVWQLMLQREFVGFVHGNIEWLQRSYDIPEAALRILGSHSD